MSTPGSEFQDQGSLDQPLQEVESEESMEQARLKAKKALEEEEPPSST